MSRLEKPSSNRDWFVIAVPTDEAWDIAEGYERDPDTFLRDMAEMAREHFERYGTP